MKRYFAGANTCDGFSSFFHQIYQKNYCRSVYLIKGGSGVGKSTAMKKISAYFQEKGDQVEEILCSSDPKSLDGVNLVDRGVVFLDATAPHAMEATMPMALEEIVDFAQFLDKKTLQKKRLDIAQCIQRKKEAYDLAYTYLHSVKGLLAQQERLYRRYTNEDVVAQHAQDVVQAWESSLKESKGQGRTLLAQAFSAQGLSDVTKELVSGAAVQFTKGLNAITHALFLDLVEKQLQARGQKPECYVSPLCPHHKTLLLAGDGALALCSGNVGHGEAIATRGWMRKIPKSDKETLHQLESQVQGALDLAQESLSQAAQHHRTLEGIYSAAMNFKALDEMVQTLVQACQEGGA